MGREHYRKCSIISRWCENQLNNASCIVHYYERLVKSNSQWGIIKDRSSDLQKIRFYTLLHSSV